MVDAKLTHQLHWASSELLDYGFMSVVGHPLCLSSLLQQETCNSSKGLCHSVTSKQYDTLNELQCTKEWTQIRKLNHLEHPLVCLEGKTVCERLYPVVMPKDRLFLTRDWQIDDTEESLTLCERVWPQEVTGHWNKLPEEINLASYTALATIHHFDLFCGWDVDKSP